MKLTVSLFVCLLLFMFTGGDAVAQKKTIILLRHAEKDISPGADKTDPELSPEGLQRAQRLIRTIKKYKPGVIYSSNFKRTKATATPLATKRKLEIQIYDHRKLNEIVDRIMQSKRKRHVVVGHNTTTPALANLLIKEDKYKALAESEYNKIWIIKIRNGKLMSVEILEY